MVLLFFVYLNVYARSALGEIFEFQFGLFPQFVLLLPLPPRRILEEGGGVNLSLSLFIARFYAWGVCALRQKSARPRVLPLRLFLSVFFFLRGNFVHMGEKTSKARAVYYGVLSIYAC
jgi:hypothetical protein